jgi:hypothetical protein
MPQVKCPWDMCANNQDGYCGAEDVELKNVSPDSDDSMVCTNYIKPQ